MPKLIVDFEWPVAKSYSYEPPDKSPARTYTLADSGERFGSLIATGPTVLRRPLDGQGAFLKILLSGRPLREIVLKAASTYGMLTCPSGEGQSEPIGLWKGLIDELKQLRKFEESGVLKLSGLSIGARLEVLLLPAHGRDRPHLAFRPVNLREAIKIFWATTIATGGTLRPCKQCGEFFEAGGENRRADAQFCSDACRNRFNNDRKRASAPS